MGFDLGLRRYEAEGPGGKKEERLQCPVPDLRSGHVPLFDRTEYLPLYEACKDKPRVNLLFQE